MLVKILKHLLFPRAVRSDSICSEGRWFYEINVWATLSFLVLKLTLQRLETRVLLQNPNFDLGIKAIIVSARESQAKEKDIVHPGHCIRKYPIQLPNPGGQHYAVDYNIKQKPYASNSNILDLVWIHDLRESMTGEGFDVAKGKVGQGCQRPSTNCS